MNYQTVVLLTKLLLIKFSLTCKTQHFNKSIVFPWASLVGKLQKLLHFFPFHSYSAKKNQDVVGKIIQEIEHVNGGKDKCPWSHAQLRGKKFSIIC